MGRSAILAYVLISFLIGVALGNELLAQFSRWWWLAAGAILLATSAVLVGSKRFEQVLWCGAGIAAGTMFSVSFQLAMTPQIAFSQDVILAGTIANFPIRTGDKQTFLVHTEAFDRPTRVYVTTHREPIYDKGDQLTLSGELEDPRAKSIPFGRYLQGQGAWSLMNNPTITLLGKADGFTGSLVSFRHQLLSALRAMLPEPLASLAAGLALGVQPTIDPTFANALRTTNLTHLAAVSGQNLSLSMLLVFRVTRRIWLHGAIALTVALLVLYAFLVGGEASVVRASIMAGVFVVAPLVGRPVEPLRLLVIALTALILVNPLALTRDLGLQLSFAALAGIVLWSPIFERYLNSLPETIKLTIATLLAAELAVLPIQLVTFNTISLVGPLANLVVGFMVPFAMGGSLLFALTGALLPIIVPLTGWLLYVPLEIMHRLTLFFAGLPGSSIIVTLPIWAKVLVMGSYAVIMGYFFRKRLRGIDGREQVSI